MHYRAKELEVSSEQSQRIDNLRTAFSRIYDAIDLTDWKKLKCGL